MSEIRVTTISDTAGTGPVTLTKQTAAKVWCNFVADGPSINDSFNTSSVTDGGNCDYTYNFSSNMGNINYSGCVAGNGGTDYNAMGRLTELAAGSCKMLMGYTSGYYDNADTSYIISGDLA